MFQRIKLVKTQRKSIYNGIMGVLNVQRCKESPYKESAFNKKNKNSVYKTMKNVLGPFTMHNQENRSGQILEYNTSYAKSTKFMTVFSE